MIFHVTDAARWDRSRAEGNHTGSTLGVELADEGYIHCSTAEQWPGVVERYYAGVPDLLLLHVDESLLSSPVVVEQLDGAPEAFPTSTVRSTSPPLSPSTPWCASERAVTKATASRWPTQRRRPTEHRGPRGTRTGRRRGRW